MSVILVVGYGSIGRRHVLNLLRFTDMKIIIFSKRKKINLDDKRISFNLNTKKDYELLNSS